jgi:predicted DNA-binding transcriptional regulator YafY
VTEPGDQPPPMLRVVHGGEPTPEELAALVATLGALAAAGPGDDSAETRLQAWSARADALRRPLRPGPGAWRAAGRVAGTRTRATW